MNRFRTLTAIAVVLACFESGILAQKSRKPNNSAASRSHLSAIEIARRVLPSVVLISCDDGKDATQGSGFFVGDGLVVTNFHVIKGMRRGTARTVGGKRHAFPISHVLQIDETLDLALLGIYDAYGRGMSSLLLNSRSDMSVGETIYAFGNPEGLTGTMSPGIVSARLRRFQDRSLLQISAPISSGSSGGPVVDSRGQVIGVAVGALKEGQNLNFAVPAPSVRLFLDRWYKDNDPKISLWTGLINLPEQEVLRGEWVWLPR